jgi:PmbA protein
MSFANLVNEIGRSSSYDNVIGGFSFLNNKLNKNVSSDIFSLYDVGNLNGGHASAPFDYEGRPSKPTEIIGSGIMKNYLTNTSQSIKYNLPATSNSSILNVSPTNLVVPIGKKSNEKLIQKMDEGLIITNSWYHRYQNYMTGDFSLLPRDAIFKVKEGKIIGSVKDVRISGNMIDVMKNIDDMSNKKESILNWESSIPSDVPAALIKNLNFTSI